MESIGLIVIVFVVITIISAVSAAKKKPSGNSDEQGEVPRKPVMSDIQRAFMMMSGLNTEDDEQKKRDTILSNFNAPPAAPSPVKSGAATVLDEGGSNFGKVRSGSVTGDSPIERDAGYKSDYGTFQSGSNRGETLIGKELGINGVATSGSLFGTTLIDRELNSDRVSSGRLTDNSNEKMEHRLDESVEQADIAESNRDRILSEKQNARPSVKLFENQSDYVKAIIYSEILAKRAPGGRGAVKR